MSRDSSTYCRSFASLRALPLRRPDFGLTALILAVTSEPCAPIVCTGLSCAWAVSMTQEIATSVYALILAYRPILQIVGVLAECSSESGKKGYRFQIAGEGSFYERR